MPETRLSREVLEETDLSREPLRGGAAPHPVRAPAQATDTLLRLEPINWP